MKSKLIVLLVLLLSSLNAATCISCDCGGHVDSSFESVTEVYDDFFEDLNTEIENQLEVLDKQKDLLETSIQVQGTLNQFENHLRGIAINWQKSVEKTK